MNEGPAAFGGFAIGFVFGALIVGMVTGNMVKSIWRTECVTRGVAEWSVADNGETSFKWLVEPKAEKVDKEI